MDTFRTFTLLLTVTLLSSACRKEEPPTPILPVPTATTILRIEHHVDGAPLLYNTIQYTNEAGHDYSVTRLEYYISRLTLLGASCCGTPDHVIEGPFYINGDRVNAFDLGAVPAGEYRGATLLLGLAPELNLTGALPNTPENIGMAWPDMMGGGYHFLKFEGHFLNGTTPTGYAMHIGRNENLPLCDLPQSFAHSSTASTITLRFNLNEVFRDPHTYDLPTGNYSMGSMALMALLRENCVNAFTLQHHVP